MNGMIRKLRTGLSLAANRRWSDFALALKDNLSHQEPSEIAARAWDEAVHIPGTQWQDTPCIAQRWNRLVTGNPEQGYIEYVTEKYLTSLQPRNVLSLGCGDGWWERAWAERYPFVTLHGYDISPKSIERARQQAAGVNSPTTFDYQVVDLNLVELEDDAFDLVLMNAALHHVSNLEHVLSQISKSLTAKGLFILNEFVGPSRFQWTDRQIEIINGLVSVLPPHYRQSLQYPGNFKAEVCRPSIEHMLRTDPSEAVRSAEILSQVPEFFEVLEYKPWGGSILHLLLYEIAGNFSDKNAQDVKLLQLLFDVEDLLMEIGDVSSDFAFLVCGPK